MTFDSLFMFSAHMLSALVSRKEFLFEHHIYDLMISL
jgi:hypothetical protein